MRRKLAAQSARRPLVGGAGPRWVRPSPRVRPAARLSAGGAGCVCESEAYDLGRCRRRVAGLGAKQKRGCWLRLFRSLSPTPPPGALSHGDAPGRRS